MCVYTRIYSRFIATKLEYIVFSVVMASCGGVGLKPFNGHVFLFHMNVRNPCASNMWCSRGCIKFPISDKFEQTCFAQSFAHVSKTNTWWESVPRPKFIHVKHICFPYVFRVRNLAAPHPRHMRLMCCAFFIIRISDRAENQLIQRC